MPEQTIAERLFLEADQAEHDDYFYLAKKRRDEYLDTRPRIDTGEGLIYLIEDLDKLYEQCCRDAGRTLRKIRVNTDDAFLLLEVDPFPGPFPWEK